MFLKDVIISQCSPHGHYACMFLAYVQSPYGIGHHTTAAYPRLGTAGWTRRAQLQRVGVPPARWTSTVRCTTRHVRTCVTLPAVGVDVFGRLVHRQAGALRAAQLLVQLAAPHVSGGPQLARVVRVTRGAVRLGVVGAAVEGQAGVLGRPELAGARTPAQGKAGPAIVVLDGSFHGAGTGNGRRYSRLGAWAPLFAAQKVEDQ